jgi:hypothetical protein
MAQALPASMPPIITIIMTTMAMVTNVEPPIITECKALTRDQRTPDMLGRSATPPECERAHLPSVVVELR